MDVIQDNRPLMVSVRCATYNHAPYIRQCLDGFVMQKTNFRFEVIVHDDASTDGTTEIVREFAEKYPDIIRPMYEEENQYSKNQMQMDNAIDNCLTGKYVAICEGDDYWMDKYKLQKQYDYMESHPNCSLCFHPHYCLYPNGYLKPRRLRINKKEYSVKDLIWRGGESFSTNSFFFRRQHYLNREERPSFWKQCTFGDEPLMYFMALNGTIGCLKDLMSVYRVQAQGSWTSRNINTKSRLKSSIRTMIVMHKQFDDYTNYKYHFFVLLKLCRIKIRYMKAIIRCYVNNLCTTK